MNSTAEAFNSSWLLSLDVPIELFPISLRQQVYRYVVVTIGFLINIFFIVVIRWSRQLHNPRHVFWAAISLIDQLYMIQILMEIVAIVGQNRTACQIFALNSGVNYTIMLLFLVLAALDRYLAIARYEWYKKKVTNRGVIYLLSATSMLTYFIVTSPFWTGFKSIKTCTVNLTHMHFVLVYDLVLGVSCVVLHAMVFIQSRIAITKHASIFRQTPIALRFISSTSYQPSEDAFRNELRK